LRNRIEHDPERIHAPQTTASEVQELFRFHENFVRTSLRTLEELDRKGEGADQMATPAPSPHPPSQEARREEAKNQHKGAG
jgi:hypothetical protein